MLGVTISKMLPAPRLMGEADFQLFQWALVGCVSLVSFHTTLKSADPKGAAQGTEEKSRNRVGGPVLCSQDPRRTEPDSQQDPQPTPPGKEHAQHGHHHTSGSGVPGGKAVMAMFK